MSRQPLLPDLRTIRDPALLRRQLKWLLGIRLVVVSSVALLYFLLTLLPVETVRAINPRFLVVVAGFTYVASLAYIALLQLVPGREALHAYAQFVSDLLLITALVYWFGGVNSPFSMLYLVVISIAAVLLRRSAGVLIANLAYLLYAGASLGLYFGWIPVPTDLGFEPPTLARVVYNLITHLFGFYGVAFLTSYLARNVTLAERELEEKREDLADLQIVYHDVVQSMSSGLITTDEDGTITSINRLGLRLLRRTQGPLIGKRLTETPLFDAERWKQQSRLCQIGGKVRDEINVDLGDEEARYVGYTLTPLADAHGERKGFILVYQDLTELHKLEQELRIRDRMVAVGELAAGIAHEIGNPLAAISGSVQMLLPSAEDEPSRRKLLDILLRESRRLDRTIKSFLQFARPKERSAVHFDVAELLAEQVELLGNSEEVQPSHTVELALDPSSVTIIADPDQISQIFWNLTRNGLRAMPDGGTLSISGRLTGRSYRIEVRDTGRGMSEDERAKLFQPFKSFFDEGSGIGMAIVYRIVEEHDGRLSVSSAPGQGTSIAVEIPIGVPEPAGVAEAAR